MSMETPLAAHPLDQPVWSALTSGWSHLAQGEGLALRLDPAFGPFGASADESAAARGALARLAVPGNELWVLGAQPVELPRLTAIRTAPLTQMVAESVRPVRQNAAIVSLGDSDAVEMRALAALTEPGPFARRTHEFGFVGIRDGKRLVAMAGERMLLEGFTEVSGVCTHPDHRGQGGGDGQRRHEAEAMQRR